MHELSLALALLDGVEEECARHAPAGGLNVRSIQVRLGARSGVSWDALSFAFETATQGTAFEGSRLVAIPAPGAELEVIALEVDP